MYTSVTTNVTIHDWLLLNKFSDGPTDAEVKSVEAQLNKLIAKFKLPIVDINTVNAGDVEVVEPTIIKKAASVTSALAKEALSIITKKKKDRIVTQQRATEKLNFCKTNVCGKYNSSKETCSSCGCYVKFKTRLKSASCPHGYW